YENKKQKLDLYKDALTKNVLSNINLKKQSLNLIKSNYFLKNPESIYSDKIKKLNNLIEKLEILNPIGVLKRGYSLTYKDKKLVKTINDININDNLTIKFYNGNINVN